MALSPIGNSYPPVMPLASERNLQDPQAARLQGSDGQPTATGAIDERSAALGAQKTADSTRDSSQNGQEPDRKTLETALNSLKNFVTPANSNVQFSIDEDSGIRVVKVVDKDTDQVIRQMPSKEVVELAKALDKLQGLIIRQTA